jgi:hypothetical protein
MYAMEKEIVFHIIFVIVKINIQENIARYQNVLEYLQMKKQFAIVMDHALDLIIVSFIIIKVIVMRIIVETNVMLLFVTEFYQLIIHMYVIHMELVIILIIVLAPVLNIFNYRSKCIW